MVSSMYATEEPQKEEVRPVQSGKRNTLSIVGFVLSFFVSIAGIICSAIGLKQCKQRQEAGKGLAIAGLIIGSAELVLSVFMMPVLILMIVAALSGPSSPIAIAEGILLSYVGLALTVVVMIYYCYIANHSDRDVSFFLSVLIISVVLNLVTLTIGTYGLGWLYIAVAVVFFGVGFALSPAEAVGSFADFGRWLKHQFSAFKIWGFNVLCFIVFPVGIILYFVKHDKDRAFACQCGKASLWGIICWAILIWAIVGAVVGAAVAA